MFGFFHGNFQKFPKMHIHVQVSKTLGRLIVQKFTTDVSNHLINFYVVAFKMANYYTSL